MLDGLTAFVAGANVAPGEPVDPEGVAETVAYLASEHGRRATAEDVNVDAGTIWY